MRDWKRFVEERLALPGLKEARERDLVEEVASQLEDLYLEAVARGRSEAAADELASSHVEDWGAFASELMRSDRGRRRSKVDRLAQQSGEALRERG